MDDPRETEPAAGDARANETTASETAPSSESRSDAADKAEQEKKLDKAVADTFPASDPIAPGHPTGDDEDEPRRPVDRKAPLLDVELVKELARKLKREKS